MKSSSKKILFVVLVVLLGIITTTIFFKSNPNHKSNDSHLFGLCGDENFITVKNPSKNLQVRGFIRDCGATTDFVSHVVIDEGSKTETVLILKGYRAKQCNVQWENPDVLDISCSVPGSSVVMLKENYKDVKIFFRNNL